MRFLNSFQKKDLSGEIAILRVDFNIQDAEISGRNLRLKSVLPTIRFLIKRGVKVVILSHRGRPLKKSKVKNQKSKLQVKIQKELTLRSFVKILSRLLKKPVRFIDFKRGFNASEIRKIITTTRDSIFLLENLRFLPGEKKNDKQFAKQLASLGGFYPHTKRGLAPSVQKNNYPRYGVGIYVNDAFSVSHRANASVAAITKFLPSYAGLALENELKNLSKAMKNPKKPLVIILGGAKISDKTGVIKNFLKRADYFLIGGGIANTFFAAQGLPVGDSLYEKKMIFIAKQLLKSKKIILPEDVIIKDKKILDIGPKTIEKYNEIIKKAKTIVWNGPMGYFENPEFAEGSKAIAQAILKSRAFLIVGGGETTSVLLKTKSYKPKANFFLSTGGGAMLEYLSGKKLPGITALK